MANLVLELFSEYLRLESNATFFFLYAICCGGVDGVRVVVIRIRVRIRVRVGVRVRVKVKVE
jgi:hypothetical protein